MFPRKFVNDAKWNRVNHNAILFATEKDEKETTALLTSMGIRAFVKPDNPAGGYNAPLYDDGRIAGSPTYNRNAGCCAFTKNTNVWFLFPIHMADLKNVGLDEQDLIHWIHFLNNMKIGFKYKYFGEQEGPETTVQNGSHSFYNFQHSPTNTFFWVAVPKFGNEVHVHKPYLHWILLRYLFNGQISTQNSGSFTEKSRLAYYNIPRIAMMFHEDYGVTPIKSILYAHAANPFYSGYGLTWSDGVNTANYKPCLNLNSIEFKRLWNSNACQNSSTGGSCINGFLTKTQSQAHIRKEYPDFPDMSAPYDHNHLFSLFDKGDYEGFIKHIKDSYKKIKDGKTKSESVAS